MKKSISERIAVLKRTEDKREAARISKVLAKGQFGKLAIGPKNYDSRILLPEVNYKD